MSKPKRSPLAWLLTGFIRFYQLVLSPILGPNCRFQPTCSAYSIEALRVHGGLKGGWLALRRILKCHPITILGGSYGYDPVPSGQRDGHECQIEDEIEDGKTKSQKTSDETQGQA